MMAGGGAAILVTVLSFRHLVANRVRGLGLSENRLARKRTRCKKGLSEKRNLNNLVICGNLCKAKQRDCTWGE